MTDRYVPTMPTPAVLAALATARREVPVRDVIARIANAVAGAVTEQATSHRTDTVAHPGLLTDPERRAAAVKLDRALRAASAALDDAVDLWDIVFPPPTEPVGDLSP
jgi:hypothetical protein